MRVWALAAFVLVACAPQARVLGEALVVVDTDLSVPQHVNRLRIDLYDASASKWYASRDVARTKPTDWPASFAIVPPENGSADVLVRLRAYADGHVRDYRGERFRVRDDGAFCAMDECKADSPPACCAIFVPPEVEHDGQPRLFRDDSQDTTPPTEPEPNVTIDRLLRIHVTHDARTKTALVLRGSCVGTMADLRGMRTCVDTEAVLVPISDGSDPSPASSLVGSFAARVEQRCSSATLRASSPLHDEEVCVDGGVFILGGRDGFALGAASNWPERFAIVSPFVLDKYEVTVGRWRDAMAHGFPLSPRVRGVGDERCTFTTAPGMFENHPVNCIVFDEAKAFCEYQGGELPSEVEWEWAARAAGRPSPTRYPWGADEEAPDCARGIWGRSPLVNDQCLGARAIGTGSVDEDDGDVSPLGIVKLGGNVGEFVRDASASRLARCWLAAPLASPGCIADGGKRLSRGGNWGGAFVYMAGDNARPELLGTARFPNVGLRCKRSP